LNDLTYPFKKKLYFHYWKTKDSRYFYAWSKWRGCNVSIIH